MVSDNVSCQVVMNFLSNEMTFFLSFYLLFIVNDDCWPTAGGGRFRIKSKMMDCGRW